MLTTETTLLRPIALTEKANRLREKGQYVFRVARTASKIEIRDAVQKLFGVTVVRVNTLIVRGKDKRMGRGVAKRPNWKKAVVTLKQGDSIQFFDTE